MVTQSIPPKVAVVGAGLMGTGIAHAFASTGHRVALVDVSAAALDRAAASIGRIVADGVRLGKLSQERADQAVANLSTGSDLAAAATPNPARVIGMHFFNPVHKMKLVEIILGIATSPEAVARTRAYAEALGKTSIVVNEAPGFTTSRMSAMLGNEAMYMLQEGTASAEDIDTALRLGLNHPMGPLELGDLTGWDTRLAVLQYLHQTLGEKYRPCPLILKMVKAGRTGRKTGHGVYRYENGEKLPGSGLKVSPP